MRCQKCGEQNREPRRFCAQCGMALNLRCVSCGSENAPGEKFCGECGIALQGATFPEPLGPSAQNPTAPGIRITAEQTDGAAPADGERKTVTALFADIKGSMELIEDLDPEEARAIVDPALSLMMDSVHHYGGYVAQSTGDGIFALFGAPVAHEDHPQRALHAAIRLQDEMCRYSAKLRASGNLPIEARVGVNTGEVVFRSIPTGEGHVEYTPIGHSTGLAARMQVLAPTGSIATTDATRKLCEGYFIFKPLGPAVVKGASKPVEVYEVTGLGPLRTRLQRAAGRGLTKFVGREREMEAMRHAAELAATGHGQIVAAVAEPGVGKSRLFHEFKAKNQSGWMVLEALSVSYGKESAYLPVLELLHGYFEIGAGDDARKRREKVAGKIAMLDRALEDTLPYLFGLLGIYEGEDTLAQMDGQVKKRRILDAIKRILLRESLNQPLMVLIEDLHWIDEATQALLNLLADSIANSRILLLVNYRTEYSHQWTSKTYYTQLRLDPLGKESADEMIAALLGSSGLARSVQSTQPALGSGSDEWGKPGEQPGAGEGADLAALKRLIIEKTEGNPFFMEETVQVLLDEGALVRNGAVHLTKPVSEVKIPATVQGILAARIDRLPTDTKDLLQTLAVIGREFPMSLIRAVVMKSDDNLKRLLNDLQLGEFIYEQPAIGDTEYIFKHALTREVAYNSVLIERRKQLHGHIGAALETLYANSIDDCLDALARHYSRCGNVSKAFEFYERAGRQAVRRSAYTEAMRDFTTALELLQRMPQNAERNQREFVLQTSLGPVLMATKGFAAPETERTYLRAEELAETGGTAEQRFALLIGLFGFAYVAGNLNAARELLKKNWDFVNQHPDPVFVLETIHHDWSLALSAGELEIAQRHVERGLELYEKQLRSVRVPLYSAHHPAVCAYGWGAHVLWLRGHPEAAERYASRCVALADGLEDSVSLTYALWTQSVVYKMLRAVQPALRAAETAARKAEELGFPWFLSNSRIVEGWALAELGKPDEGVSLIQKAISDLYAIRAGLLITFALATLSETCAQAGRIDEGLDAISAALRDLRQRGERFWEAEIHRLHGELLRAQSSSDPAAARHCFESAIEVAHKQGAKSLELRASTSLARLLLDTGRRDEARTMLAEIYNWFTEGFDTADLKDAKALLEELNA